MLANQKRLDSASFVYLRYAKDATYSRSYPDLGRKDY